MHLKRQKAPKKWPIERKGTTYLVRPNFGIKQGIPLLLILRDMLKIAQNRKEVKKAIYKKHILVNNKFLKDEKNIATLFDIISIVPSKKRYRVGMTEKGKFSVEEMKESAANQKIAKIINKKTLKGKKTQLNLIDGRNFLSDLKCNTNDSVLIDLKTGKIEKCLPLIEKKKVIIFAGKHAGKEGVIKKINSDEKMAELNIDEKKVNVLIKQIMVVE